MILAGTLESSGFRTGLLLDQGLLNHATSTQVLLQLFLERKAGEDVSSEEVRT